MPLHPIQISYTYAARAIGRLLDLRVLTTACTAHVRNMTDGEYCRGASCRHSAWYAQCRRRCEHGRRNSAQEFPSARRGDERLFADLAWCYLNRLQPRETGSPGSGGGKRPAMPRELSLCGVLRRLPTRIETHVGASESGVVAAVGFEPTTFGL